MFPPVFFSEELGIPEETLYDFLFFCETDPEFNATVKNNKINISKFLTDKSIEYKILKEETE